MKNVRKPEQVSLEYRVEQAVAFGWWEERKK